MVRSLISAICVSTFVYCSLVSVVCTVTAWLTTVQMQTLPFMVVKSAVLYLLIAVCAATAQLLLIRHRLSYV